MKNKSLNKKRELQTCLTILKNTKSKTFNKNNIGVAYRRNG